MGKFLIALMINRSWLNIFSSAREIIILLGFHNGHARLLVCELRTNCYSVHNVITALLIAIAFCAQYIIVICMRTCRCMLIARFLVNKHTIMLQSCALSNWIYFRFRCGYAPVLVNWNSSFSHHVMRYARSLYIVWSLVRKSQMWP